MNIRYFAWLKQRTGCAQETVDPPASVATVGALKGWLAERHPRFGEACEATGIVKCAVNHEYVQDDAAVRQQDEVAFFPPITGG